jgi:hypothetical protein
MPELSFIESLSITCNSPMGLAWVIVNAHFIIYLFHTGNHRWGGASTVSQP